MGIYQDCEVIRLWKDCPKQFKPLHAQGSMHQRQTGDVTSWPRHTCDKAEIDGIGTAGAHHDGYALGCVLSGSGRPCAVRDNHVDR